MGISANSFCPCGSGQKYKRCCKQYHDQSFQPTPLALMKSRYTAYAIGNAGYIVETTHSENREFKQNKELWKAEIETFCRATTFHKLEILKSEIIHSEAFVTFRAIMSQGEKDISFTEKSRFLQENDRWLYRSGEFL
jgi:SEC-C motif-containing protein